MKVSEAWLKEWVDPSLQRLASAEQLASQLTMAGLEVDAIHPVAGSFDRVIVAQVIRTRPHPEANKLTLCEVDVGTGLTQSIVCGARNVRAGLKVALACLGAVLPGGVTIQESMLRGELSQGMLCSTTELGLDERSDGILELPEDAPIGVDLRTYLQLDDQVFELSLTPNRADCFSVLGVAREVCALNRWSWPVVSSPSIAVTTAITWPVILDAPEGCPHYCARVVRAINPEAVTPLWIKERLRRAGIRAVHPVVDVTNYVMMDLGQPMHAFDLNAIQGDLRVRWSLPNEALTLLDGQSISLKEPVLVVSDDEGALALAGVMGGDRSAIQAHTTDVFLESAFFNPHNIAGVARRYGLCTDSSQRFERGVDPTLQRLALDRATALLQSIAGGEAGPVIELTDPHHRFLPAVIAFRPERVKRLTGLDISNESMHSMLQALGLGVERQSNDAWLVTVPPHRFDLTLDVDLVEEVIRLHGYHHLEGKPVLTAMQVGTIHPLERLSETLATCLTYRAYHETIHYSFVDPAFQQILYPDAEAYNLLNPISSELSQMRMSLWPGLLASMVYNLHRQQSTIRLFELGVVFDGAGDAVCERACLAGLLTGTKGELHWSEPSRIVDFYDLKGDVEALLGAASCREVRFVAMPHPALHPGQSACILQGDRTLGWMGVLHPRLQEALDVKTEIMVFELFLNALPEPSPAMHRSVSKYPKIRRDLSLVVSQEVSVAQIECAVREVVRVDWLKAFEVFDVYVGDSIAAGKKSLAIALTLQDEQRTLVDTEVHSVIAAVLERLERDFSIVLREAHI